MSQTLDHQLTELKLGRIRQVYPSCQDFAQKGQGVTCLCEPAVDKGNSVGQTEKRTVPLFV